MMLRTVRPPPKVVVPGAGAPTGPNPSRPAAAAAAAAYQEDDFSRRDEPSGPSRADAYYPPMSVADDPSFALAVEEEMRRMEEEFRRQLSPEALAPAPTSRVTAQAAAAPATRPAPVSYADEPYDRNDDVRRLNYSDSRSFDDYPNAPSRPGDHRQFDVVVTNDGLFDTSPEMQKAKLGSPARRKGGAISNMYGPSDDRTNGKAAKKAEYAILLKQQIDEKRALAEEQRAREVREEEAALSPVQKNAAVPLRKPNPDLFQRDPADRRQQQQQQQQRQGGFAAAPRAAAPAEVPEPYSYPSFDDISAPRLYSKMDDPYSYDPTPQVPPPGSLRGPRNDADYASAPNSNSLIEASRGMRPPAKAADARAPPRPAAVAPFAQADFDPVDAAAVEKQAKRTKQEEYRLFLEQQMNEQNERKQLETKHLKEGTLDSPPRTKGSQKPAVAQQAGRGGGEDDYYAQGAAPAQNHPSQLHSLQTNFDSRSPQPAGSPSKGLEGVHHTKVVARTKLLKDVYGSENIFPMGSPSGAAANAGGNDSPYSKKITIDERSQRDKRANYNEYKAALDIQMREKQRLKEKEQEEMKLLEKKENERLQAEADKSALAKRQEVERQRSLQAQNDAEIQSKQETIALELAKKRGTKPPDVSPPRRKAEVKPQNVEVDEPDVFSSRDMDSQYLRSPDKRRQASVRAMNPESDDEFAKKPMTPPRYSKVNVDHRQFDLRRLTEETFMDERGATPGGALQSDSYLVPVSEPLQGYPPRRNVERSQQQQREGFGAYRYRDNARPVYQSAAAPYHGNHRHLVARGARDYESVDVDDDVYDSRAQGGLSEQSLRGYSVKSRNLGAVPPAGPGEYEPNPWDRELGLLSALGDPVDTIGNAAATAAGDGARPAPSSGTPPRRGRPFEFDNQTERSLASDSYLAYLTNRRPMTQEGGRNHSSHVPPSRGVSTRGSVGEVSLASVSEHPSIAAHDDAPSEDVIVPIVPNRALQQMNKMGFELEEQNRSLRYDNLNKLLRSSEERLSRDLLAMGPPARGNSASSGAAEIDESEEVHVMPQKQRSFWNRP